MKVENLMNRDVRVCRESDTLNQAAQLMWEYDVGAVPVLNDQNQLVGMLTDRDICIAAYTQGRPLTDLPVSPHMAQQVFSCLPDASLAEAEAVMRAHQIRRLPVIEHDGRLAGIISLNDIARGVDGIRRQRNNITTEEVAATLSAICQPRRHLVIASA
jgi:CBS domain-containing protein